MMSPGSAESDCQHFDTARFSRIDEGLVQPPGGLDRHHFAQRLHSDRVGMRAAHRVVRRGDELRAAGARTVTVRSPSCTGSSV
jgi:hypothetical protein